MPTAPSCIDNSLQLVSIHDGAVGIRDLDVMPYGITHEITVPRGSPGPQMLSTAVWRSVNPPPPPPPKKKKKRKIKSN